MEDQAIIDLYWQRDQEAITETSAKYGKLCYQIAWNILACHEERRGERQRHLADCLAPDAAPATLHPLCLPLQDHP